MSSIIPKAEYSGTLQIRDFQLPCYVLEDGERILLTKGIIKSLNGTLRNRKYKNNQYLEFLEAHNLKPYIDKDIDPMVSPIVFRTNDGSVREGLKAEILPAVCKIYIKAENDGVLTKVQEPIVNNCKNIIAALSRIGISALVDESTGYQVARTRKALEKILDKYISNELKKWAKIFPDEFYKRMFELKGWAYNPMSVKRPSIIGKHTNDVVFERLAPEVLYEIKKKNPKIVKGNRKHKQIQWLIENIGHPKLREHLASVITLMRASTTWKNFYRLLQRSLPRQNDTLELLLEDKNGKPI